MGKKKKKSRLIEITETTERNAVVIGSKPLSESGTQGIEQDTSRLLERVMPSFSLPILTEQVNEHPAEVKIAPPRKHVPARIQAPPRKHAPIKSEKSKVTSTKADVIATLTYPWLSFSFREQKIKKLSHLILFFDDRLFHIFEAVVPLETASDAEGKAAFSYFVNEMIALREQIMALSEYSDESLSEDIRDLLPEKDKSGRVNQDLMNLKAAFQRIKEKLQLKKEGAILKETAFENYSRPFFQRIKYKALEIDTYNILQQKIEPTDSPAEVIRKLRTYFTEIKDLLHDSANKQASERFSGTMEHTEHLLDICARSNDVLSTIKESIKSRLEEHNLILSDTGLEQLLKTSLGIANMREFGIHVDTDLNTIKLLLNSIKKILEREITRLTQVNDELHYKPTLLYKRTAHHRSFIKFIEAEEAIRKCRFNNLLLIKYDKSNITEKDAQEYMAIIQRVKSSYVKWIFAGNTASQFNVRDSDGALKRLDKIINSIEDVNNQFQRDYYLPEFHEINKASEEYKKIEGYLKNFIKHKHAILTEKSYSFEALDKEKKNLQTIGEVLECNKNFTIKARKLSETVVKAGEIEYFKPYFEFIRGKLLSKRLPIFHEIRGVDGMVTEIINKDTAHSNSQSILKDYEAIFKQIKKNESKLKELNEKLPTMIANYTTALQRISETQNEATVASDVLKELYDCIEKQKEHLERITAGLGNMPLNEGAFDEIPRYEQQLEDIKQNTQSGIMKVKNDSKSLNRKERHLLDRMLNHIASLFNINLRKWKKHEYIYRLNMFADENAWDSYNRKLDAVQTTIDGDKFTL